MTPPPAVPLLDVQGFGLEFRTRGGIVHALQDVSLRLHKGQTVGLVVFRHTGPGHVVGFVDHHHGISI